MLYYLDKDGNVVGESGFSEDEMNVKVQTSGNYTYVGEAPVGTAEATAKWRARRIDVDGNVLWADGNSKFDNAASDLTSLTYAYSS